MGSDEELIANDARLKVGPMAGPAGRRCDWDLSPPLSALANLINRCSELRSKSKTVCEYNRDVRTLVRFVGKIQLLLETAEIDGRPNINTTTPRCDDNATAEHVLSPLIGMNELLRFIHRVFITMSFPLRSSPVLFLYHSSPTSLLLTC